MSQAAHAIEFALSLSPEQSHEFLRLWHQGHRQRCQEKWPHVPEACFDPLEACAIEATTDALLVVQNERLRQISDKGYDYAHDDKFQEGQLARAAAAYALPSSRFSEAPSFWPWQEHQFNPQSHCQNLIRAGALVVAELERIERMKIGIRDPV